MSLKFFRRSLLCELPPAAADDEALLEKIANFVVARELTTAAIFLLESAKPLNFIGSQALIFFEPLVRLFLTIPEYRRFTAMLAERDTLERLIGRIEVQARRNGASR